MYRVEKRRDLARCVADAFLAGEWNLDDAVQRGSAALDRVPRWMRPVAREVFAAYQRPPRDRSRELARFIELALARRRATEAPPGVRRRLVPEPAMGRTPWPVPPLASFGELAEFLGLEIGELDWFADVRSRERQVADERLRHYRYATLPRQSGPPRVIEQPKPRLKTLQRRLLHELLDWIPAHDAAHGFTRGRSVVSHVRIHSGKQMVLRLDLEDFFVSVSAGRVFGILRSAGYPESVAHTLTGLMTNALPVDVSNTIPTPAAGRAVAKHRRLVGQLAQPHLPQGAPTSPALANLAAFRLDRRLSGLARTFELDYSRYADDLAFSGTRRLARRLEELRSTITAIVASEGFRVNRDKSVLLTHARRQRICGVVVNEHPNMPRADYDTLKAIIHNSARYGPASQNRAGVADFRAHLIGRVAWAETLDVARGRRLRRELSKLTWEE